MIMVPCVSPADCWAIVNFFFALVVSQIDHWLSFLQVIDNLLQTFMWGTGLRQNVPLRGSSSTPLMWLSMSADQLKAIGLFYWPFWRALYLVHMQKCRVQTQFQVTKQSDLHPCIFTPPRLLRFLLEYSRWHTWYDWTWKNVLGFLYGKISLELMTKNSATKISIFEGLLCRILNPTDKSLHEYPLRTSSFRCEAYYLTKAE